MSSASAICDALVTMLSATSVMGASMVTISDWGVLEKASACCAVVGFQGYEHFPVEFGNPADVESSETYFVWSYVKDTGNRSTDLSNIGVLVNKVANCLAADDTLLGTVEIVTRFTATRRPTEVVETGGFAGWYPIEGAVEIKQL